MCRLTVFILPMDVFQEGIQPMWEDDRNCKGGRWVINLEKRKRDELDNFWLETVRSCFKII